MGVVFTMERRAQRQLCKSVFVCVCCVSGMKEGKKAIFDILETIHYEQLTSKTILFKCHRRIVPGVCSHAEATAVHNQECTFFKCPILYNILSPSLDLLQPLQYSGPSLCNNYSILLLLHVTSPDTSRHLLPHPHMTHLTEKDIVRDKKAFDINIPSSRCHCCRPHSISPCLGFFKVPEDNSGNNRCYINKDDMESNCSRAPVLQR